MPKTKDVIVETSYKTTGVYSRTITDAFTSMELLSSHDSNTFIFSDDRINSTVTTEAEQSNVHERLRSYDSDDATNPESENFSSPNNSFCRGRDSNGTENMVEARLYHNVRRTFCIIPAIEDASKLLNSVSENLTEKDTSGTRPTKGLGILMRNGSANSDILIIDKDRKRGSTHEKLVGGKSPTKDRKGVGISTNGGMHKEQNNHVRCGGGDSDTKIVEKIIGHSWEANGQLKYLIILENVREPLWKNEYHLINADELIQNYWIRVGKFQLESINHPLLQILNFPDDTQTGLLLSNAHARTPEILSNGNENNAESRSGEVLHETNINLDTNGKVWKTFGEKNTSIGQDSSDHEVEMSLDIKGNGDVLSTDVSLTKFVQENSAIDRDSQEDVNHGEAIIEDSCQNDNKMKDMVEVIQNFEKVVKSGEIFASQMDSHHINSHMDKTREEYLDNFNISQHEDSQMHIDQDVNVDHQETNEPKTSRKTVGSHQHEMDVEMEIYSPEYEENESTLVGFCQNGHSQITNQKVSKFVSVQSAIVESHCCNLSREIISRKENHRNTEDHMVLNTDKSGSFNVTSPVSQKNESPTADRLNKESEEKMIGTDDTNERNDINKIGREQIEFDFRMFELKPLLFRVDDCKDADMFVDKVEVDTNWDPHVEYIETIQRDPKTEKLYIVIRWKSGLKTIHWADDANTRCPQKILNFYESKTKIVIRRHAL
ncbi:7057_t:CDS:2 [Acaulospora morrowiae]|uniref:7057_t:CDS:1 n=1 Tax=Acaulospora morrowiae TaxID=94023 RepID=A0A9N8VXJ5_9GLOM|nr:7057_t:CDS:2 [Acaulospora morrowiae]